MDICNPITKRWIDAYIARPKATLLINCNNDVEAGIQVAEHIYNGLKKSPKTPLYTINKGEAKSLGISEVRELQKRLSLRADSTAEYSRFVLVSDAEDLTIEAQNSLLKLLEELPNKTVLMLVTTQPSRLLPTINSRCFRINVLPITYDQAYKYGKAASTEDSAIRKAYIISEGHASIFKKLIHNEDDSYQDIIISAKQFIQSSVVERQDLLSKIYNSDIMLTDLLQSLKLMARSGMRNAKNLDSKQRWKNMLVTIIDTEKQIESNVQTKLAMLALSVSL
jgi:DNA polymerase III delta prime subunit